MMPVAVVVMPHPAMNHKIHSHHQPHQPCGPECKPMETVAIAGFLTVMLLLIVAVCLALKA